MFRRLHLLSIFTLICAIGFACSTARIDRSDSIAYARPDSSILADGSQIPSDSLLMKILEIDGFPVSSHNRIRLFTRGQDKFNDLFDAIGQAKHHVHMEYFNFRNDSISSALFSLLKTKVAQGVEVRILFDDFGNWSNNRPLKRHHLDSIRASGIEIVKFDPIVFPYINHASSRDHRKIVVIDGLIGYTGGMNVADYYIKGLPKIGPWLDMHLRIEGEAVADLQRIFLGAWNKEAKQSIEGDQYFPPIILPDSLARQSVSIVDRRPNKTPESIKEAYTHSINLAGSHVRIINPYFVPTSSISRAIKRALERGIEISIMVPEKSDIPFTPDAMLHKLNKLSKRGAKVLLYQGGFHHSKAMTVDNTFCTVGSANLNSRSLRYDYETNAFIFDRGMTAQIDTIFRQDAEHCVQLDRNYWHKRSLWRKFVGWFANLFTPFL